MRTDAKVIHLSKATAKAQLRLPAGRLPVALINVRDKAAQRLKVALRALFDSADDTLFEMADRAGSNTEQSAFFETMRDLRMKRRNIERSFLQRIFEAFATPNQPGHAVQATEPPSLESLALVSNDKLEESVAIDAMINKAMGRNALALGHLTARLNALLNGKLDTRQNPLGPHALCDFFIAACQVLGVDIRVKLIIFKLFEKYALSNLDSLYAEANQSLAAAGILPGLRSTPTHRQRPRAATAQADSSRDQEPTDGDLGEAFATLQSLLSAVRDSPPLGHHASDDAVPISRNDLMRLLSYIQNRAPQAVDEFHWRDYLEQLLRRASAKSGRPRVIGQVDDDVINLVSMLFEFILDDRTLPDSLKALIARLQIPILKVAVLDKSFFSRGSHPARRLLNELASAAVGWGDQDEAQRDSLYQKVDQIVTRLLNDFSDDPAIFSELLADFLAFTGDERHRSELLEQRTRDAEEGRAKAEMARQKVAHALNQRLLGKTLPEVVVRLLQEAWSKVLLLTCLKHGTQSRQWQAALATMDDLIWSVGAHQDRQARQHLLKLVPRLLKSLREGLVSAAFDPFSTGDFFSQLETLHIQALQQDKPSEPRPAEARGGTAGTPPGEHLPAASAPAPGMVEVIEEIVLLAPGESRDEEKEVSLPDDDQALTQVDDLRIGSWVEFEEDEEHKLRCKLAAVIKPTGRYIFVNRTGMKVLEKTRMGLAIEFRRGAIRLLDDALLFDRALESVIGKLRRMRGR